MTQVELVNSWLGGFDEGMTDVARVDGDRPTRDNGRIYLRPQAKRRCYTLPNVKKAGIVKAAKDL